MHARDLPWRHRRTAYRVTVSEFMLQQTQVKTVIPYFERWLERFPDFDSLARADETEVLRYWQGLGYYSRARNLLKLARAISAMPQPPVKAAEWQKLPGVGPYTAAAIASLSGGEAVAVVDGNVSRVLARVLGEEREFADKTTLTNYFRPVAQALLDPDNPARHNEAMMELGATVCLPRQPVCTVCPLLSLCQGKSRAGEIPGVRKSSRRKHSIERILWLAGNQVLLERHAETRSRLAGMMEIPEKNQLPESIAAAATRRLIRKRSIGRDDYEETILLADGIPQIRELSPGLEWVPLKQLAKFPVSGPHRRWIEEVRANNFKE